MTLAELLRAAYPLPRIVLPRIEMPILDELRKVLRASPILGDLKKVLLASPILGGLKNLPSLVPPGFDREALDALKAASMPVLVRATRVPAIEVVTAPEIVPADDDDLN